MCRHIQEERGTVKCNRVNNYGKKTSTEIRFQGFWGSDANIENKGQHPSLQIFFELMLRYNISVDQFLLETPPEKNTQRRQLDALLDGMSNTGIRIVSATAKEIAEVETEGR